jgi:hypothetical protein
MAIVMNKRKVLRIAGKVKVIQPIENGIKRVDLCGNFVS